MYWLHHVINAKKILAQVQFQETWDGPAWIQDILVWFSFLFLWWQRNELDGPTEQTTILKLWDQSEKYAYKLNPALSTFASFQCLIFSIYFCPFPLPHSCCCVNATPCAVDNWMGLLSSNRFFTSVWNAFPGYTLVAGLLAGLGL